MGGPVEAGSMPMYFERTAAWGVVARRRGALDHRGRGG